MLQFTRCASMSALAHRALSSKPGFTMFEAMVVTAIVAIFSAVAIPEFTGTLRNARVNAAAFQVASDVRMIRSLAVSVQTPHGWHSGADAGVNRPNQFRLERATSQDGQNWPAASAGIGGNVITVWTNLSAIYRNVQITSVRNGAGTDVGRIVFNSRGISVNPSTGSLQPVTIVLTASNGPTRRVQVSAAGGVWTE